MDNKENIEYTRMRVPFIAVVFAVFACAARIVDDPRLSVPDDGALGMVYYERYVIYDRSPPKKTLSLISVYLFYQCFGFAIYQPCLNSDSTCPMHSSLCFFSLRCKLFTPGMAACWTGSAHGSGFRIACKLPQML